jgi:hypothetical protein
MSFLRWTVLGRIVGELRRGTEPTSQEEQLIQDEMEHSSTPSYKELLQVVIDSINLAHDGPPLFRVFAL